MNYLTEPKGAARSYALGQTPLYEPRGQAVPFGQAPLYEPRGQAVPFGQTKEEIAEAAARGAAEAWLGREKPEEEKILGMSKPVAYGFGAVLLAGALYFALRS
jgi:hypothetical protein